MHKTYDFLHKNERRGGATAILWKGKNCYFESVRNSVGDTE